jgi:hypothetical protein
VLHLTKLLCKSEAVVKKTAILLSAVFGLSGCGLMQQYQYQKQYQEHQEKMASFSSEMDLLDLNCKSNLLSDSDVYPLQKYLNLGKADPTVEQLSSTKKPNSQEKGAILVWDEIASKCNKNRIDLMVKYGWPSPYVQNSIKYADDMKQLRADLWAGKITYGDYLKSSQAARAAYVKNNTSIDAELEAKNYQRNVQATQLQIQQQQANAQQQAAIAAQTSATMDRAMQNYYQSRQQYNQQLNAPGSYSNPVQTNCRNVGGTVQCQTYSY